MLANFINKLSNTKFDEHNIWAANGSNEIIQSIFLGFGGNGALGFEPSYSVHKIIAQVTNTPWYVVARNADFSLNIPEILAAITKSKPSITFVTTPNNPTGTASSIEELKQIAVQMKKVGGLLVVDEAYAEFSNHLSAATLINEFENVLVIRTMSKAFAFAGVRLGYLVANTQVINAMMIVRLPYHLSSLTQAAAQVALENTDLLLGKVAQLRDARDKLITKFSSTTDQKFFEKSLSVLIPGSTKQTSNYIIVEVEVEAQDQSEENAESRNSFENLVDFLQTKEGMAG